MKQLWLSRDGYIEGCYELWQKRPKRDGLEWRAGGLLVVFCVEEFEALTGIKLAPITCRRVEIDIALVPQKAKVK